MFRLLYYRLNVMHVHGVWLLIRLFGGSKKLLAVNIFWTLGRQKCTLTRSALAHNAVLKLTGTRLNAVIIRLIVSRGENNLGLIGT